MRDHRQLDFRREEQELSERELKNKNKNKNIVLDYRYDTAQPNLK